MTIQHQSFPPVPDLLKRLGIWLEKGKSQHFLRSQEICARIADLAGLTREHLAVEVGAGLGNLTVELSARARKVVSVEIDEAFRSWHEYLAASYPEIEFVYTDFLVVDLESLVTQHAAGGPVCGVGNLPYQVTSEILFRFVDSPLRFDALVFMVQKEVAERIAAGPGKRSAGALTYKIALRYTCELAFTIGPELFLPPPRVDSALIVLRPLDEPFVASVAERQRVYTLLDGLFRYRRKTLANALLQSGAVAARDDAEAVLRRVGVDPVRRPETLEITEVLALSRALAEE